MYTADLYPRFSAAEYARRHAAMRVAMQEADLAALVMYSTVGAYNEVLYLSNFLATREAMLVFPIEGEPALFVQMYNHVPNARRVASIADVRWGGPDTSLAAAEYLQQRALTTGRIGLVGALPFKYYESLKRALPQVAFVDFSRQMSQLRLIKSDEEIAFLRRGAQFSDLAIEALAREARPGLTEHQLAAIVEVAYLASVVARTSTTWPPRP